MKEEINKIEGIQYNLVHVLGSADHLFKDEKGSREIRVHTFKSGDFNLIINDSLCLWFNKKENGYVYDGCEMGDYKNIFI